MLNSGMNPNVVRTALDEVFYQTFDMPAGPGMATEATDAIFKQSSVDRKSVIAEVFMGTGKWQERDEEENVHKDTARVDDQITFTVANFDNSIDIPKMLFDDDQHDLVNKTISDFADMARITKLDNAMKLFRNAFTTTLTADGIALLSASHVNINGDTISNLVSGALTDATLFTGMVNLAEQKNQRGIVRGHEGVTLLVPPALYKTACEIIYSGLRSGTADNDGNVYNMPGKYNITVYQSNYLGAAAGGSDTAWYLLANNHNIYRWVREDVWTGMIDYKDTPNNVYVYKGGFREVYGAITYEGIVGATGV